MKRAAALVSVSVLLLCGTVALAAPGDLDPSFDGDGARTVDFGGEDTATGVLVAPNGKLVIAGPGAASYLDSDFSVARLSLDGSLDTSFSGDGKSVTDFGRLDFANAAALQADGKIVVAGSSSNGGFGSNFALVRLTAAGDLDSSFDGDGRKTIDFGGEDGADDVLVQPDGRIVLAGLLFGDLAIVRLGLDGEVEGGGRRAPIGESSSAAGMALQPDGKIVVAGVTQTGSSRDVAVARYNPDLSLDTSFDGDGKRTLDSGGSERASDVLVQPDGRILVVVSHYATPDADLLVIRLNPDGSLDTGFDGDGAARVTAGSVYPTAGALQANGKIVVVGYDGSEALVFRFQPGGALDTTFSYDGKQIVPLPGMAADVALTSDGRIAAAGLSANDAFVALVEGDSPGSGGGSGGPGGGPGGGGSGGGKARVPRCAGKQATIVGTGKANRLKGTRRGDVIVSLGGNDTVDGGGGNDLICAGDGDDRVKGSTGNDRLYGQKGRDRLEGGVGNDRLAGDAGKDSLLGGADRDRLSGGSGRDGCNGGAGKDSAACERRNSL